MLTGKRTNQLRHGEVYCKHMYIREKTPIILLIEYFCEYIKMSVKKASNVSRKNDTTVQICLISQFLEGLVKKTCPIR